MKKTIIVAAFLITSALLSWSQSQTNGPAAAKSTAVKAAYPGPEYLTYKPGTAKMLKKVYRLYLGKKTADAEKAALALLDYEPRCIEAQWLLANLYLKNGEIGNMMGKLADSGIREAKESAYERQVVYQGSRGYVLQVSEKSIWVDYNDTEVKPGDVLIVYAEGAVLRHPSPSRYFTSKRGKSRRWRSRRRSRAIPSRK